MSESSQTTGISRNPFFFPSLHTPQSCFPTTASPGWDWGKVGWWSKRSGLPDLGGEANPGILTLLQAWGSHWMSRRSFGDVGCVSVRSQSSIPRVQSGLWREGGCCELHHKSTSGFGAQHGGSGTPQQPPWHPMTGGCHPSHSKHRTGTWTEVGQGTAWDLAPHSPSCCSPQSTR